MKESGREYLLEEGKRIDGRRLDEIRPFAKWDCRGFWFRTFQRDDPSTQALLWAMGDVQMLDGIELEDTKDICTITIFPVTV